MKLAILLYGLESQSEKINVIKDKLQSQLNKIGLNKVDVVFRVNEDESIDEKKNWLLSQTTCKKYVFINADSILGDNFMILRYSAVNLKKQTQELLKLGVFSK